MSAIITYMVKYSDGSFSIKNEDFDKKTTKRNIDEFIEKTETLESVSIQRTRREFPNMPFSDGVDVYFIAITKMEV
jgi:hypothetical protein